MRSLFNKAFRGVALLALVTILAAPVLYGDDLNPNQPPGAKIGPPIGVTADAKIQPPIGLLDALLMVWQMALIQPPIG
jgi:hypothetical protein